MGWMEQMIIEFSCGTIYALTILHTSTNSWRLAMDLGGSLLYFDLRIIRNLDLLNIRFATCVLNLPCGRITPGH